MRVLVAGARGMLGTDLVSEITSRGHEAIAPGREELDVINPEHAARIASGYWGELNWVVNAAAYTAVDKAESERDLAFAINGLGPGYLGRSCGMAGVRLLHVSTDFVFDGTATEPYKEDAPTNPLGVYGESKRQGEEAVLFSGANAVIARTSWLYGSNGNSFPKTMIRAWLAGKQLRVVADQIGTPTYTGELARVLVDLAEANIEGGIYHTAGQDIASWHDVAVRSIEIYAAEVLGRTESVVIEPIKTDDWPTPAKRPKYSALSFEKTASMGVRPMCDMNAALVDFVRKLPPF